MEAPHCYLLINGKNGDGTLFLPQKSHLPFSANNAAWVKETTGLEGVQSLQDILNHLSCYKAIYLPEREGEGLKMSPDRLNDRHNQVMADPLDVRRGRMGQVAANLKNRLPFIELLDLSPIMNEARSVKSPAEITLLRKNRGDSHNLERRLSPQATTASKRGGLNGDPKRVNLSFFHSLS